MESKQKKTQQLTMGLMAIYLIVLTWIIVFKMQFSIEKLDHFRNINLIPFYGSVIINNKIEFPEIYCNVLVFIPFGLYISMIKGNWTFLKKVASIALVSLCYEVLQFIFAIGASDITDIIDNTLGGIIGIAIYFVIHRIFKTDFKINKILSIVALICTICVVTLLLFLVIVNY